MQTQSVKEEAPLNAFMGVKGCWWPQHIHSHWDILQSHFVTEGCC